MDTQTAEEIRSLLLEQVRLDELERAIEKKEKRLRFLTWRLLNGSLR